MMTPQEVSEHAFAKASFGGYNMAMVDEFLDALTEDYTALYKENTALKAKMKILVDKLEEYRSTEDAMRKTLLTAQTMADELVREAETKKAELISNAEREVQSRLAGIGREAADEEARLAAAQASTAAYVAKVQQLHRQEQDYLAGLSAITAPAAPAPRQSDQVASAVAEIEANLNRMMEHTQPAEPAAAEEDEVDTLSFQPVTAAPEPDGEETRRLNLDDLQFGKEFDL